MKKFKVSLFIFALFILSFFSYFFIRFESSEPTFSPVPSSSTIHPELFCTIAQLDGTIVVEPGAGNVFGKIVIQNKSTTDCLLRGDSFFAANYSPENQSIALQLKGKGRQPFVLGAGKEVFSQVHYPNGAHCSGPLEQVSTELGYFISQTEILFLTPRLNIPACEDELENTPLEVWPLSEEPITL